MIAGIDEAGRGALAGPVVIACVILNDTSLTTLFSDSKQLTKQKRNDLYITLKNSSAIIRYSIINHKIIDKINILEATLLGMKYSIKNLPIRPSKIIIDGNKIPIINGYNIESCVKGDQLIQEISAASICAKVLRDKIMQKYNRYINNFNFSKHKGYGTQLHYKELENHGPTSIHRRSFNLNRQLQLF